MFATAYVKKQDATQMQDADTCIVRSTAMGSATFSKDGLYRYELRRQWTDGWMLGAMLHNGSTATHEINDPTVTRLVGFAKREGAGALLLVNAAAYVATDPSALLRTGDPVGPENETFVVSAAREAKLFLVAWGAMSKYMRMKTWMIRRAIESARADLLCLGTTKGGYPKHPLYVRADQPLVPWVPGGRPPPATPWDSP